MRSTHSLLDVKMRSTGEAAAHPSRVPERGSEVLIVGDRWQLSEKLEKLGYKPLVIDQASSDRRTLESIREGRISLIIACDGGGSDYPIRRAGQTTWCR